MSSYIKPVISEKSLAHIERANEYLFHIDSGLSKTDVKRLVEEMFNVKVEDVRTKVLGGKTRRVGKARREVKGLNRKQAIVRLDKKDKISLFEIKEKKS